MPKFFEVFPTITPSKEIKDILTEAEVTKVSTNKRKDYIRVYLQSCQLIPKQAIYRLERAVKEQLFPRHALTIKVMESFRLPKDYNPSKLYYAYQDSILLEIKEHSLVDYNLLRLAKIEFPTPDTLICRFPDTLIATQKAEEIKGILQKIICERCCLDCAIQVEFEVPKDSIHRQQGESLLAGEVRRVLSQSGSEMGGGTYSERGEAPEEQNSLTGYAASESQTSSVGNFASNTGKSPSSVNSPQTANGKNTAPSKNAFSADFAKSSNFAKSNRRSASNPSRSDNPDVIYGRDFNEPSTEIQEINDELGEVVIRGEVLSTDVRIVGANKDKTLLIFDVTDFTDTIRVKIFLKNEIADSVVDAIKKGLFIKIKGMAMLDRFDREISISSITGMKKIADFTEQRMDYSEKKRTELHCHTKMSDMDGVSDAAAIVKRAIAWGHKALAITDHGVVQAFPEVAHALPKGSDFKVIYGVEAYLVDDLDEYEASSTTSQGEQAKVATGQNSNETIKTIGQNGNKNGTDNQSKTEARTAATLKETLKKLPSHHAIILAANDVGRTNLYRLVSDSHLKYFYRRPRILKSEFEKHREGLIIGSACEAGELYQSIIKGESEEEIVRLVHFYDYLEIQPLLNNAFMLKGDKARFSSMEELEGVNRKIVALGEQYHKPVVATCDVHFLDPKDEVYRRIIMAGKGFKDADDQAPLYLRTTEEMLLEFAYLGSEKAQEVVITNPEKIANMCERISPVRPDKCPPVIEDSDKSLREICYLTAHEIYGETLPDIVTARLERELDSIISNGFAVMYMIAEKLVKKSNEDGYLVGSRGSVGSSFVATMAGITEVNPLPPHYYCKDCHFSDFDSEAVTAYEGRAGCDLPDRKCPKCGSNLQKEGFDIPFETFLGFKGNKEPDIDLNFSGEYQSKAHKYTEVIFGEGQCFRAGTIGTLADKNAFGYVKKYYDEREITKRGTEIARIANGCVGVRKSTGQHPGGIIVLPLGEEIHSFTPVQHPANKTDTDIITTHFDYHSIDHNLLKLDILGHDDPTMIRMLEDLTGTNAQTISLDDKTVMSLFRSTEALGIRPDDILGCPLGALGIPEFGTDFVLQMLLDTKPECFSDLVRISGLSHGTDVWLSNAKDLIKSGLATISTAICTRDDIMTYLIRMGVDSELSFTIMESVRKGKGLTPDWEAAMKEQDVPDWYIDSCKKIKYMFPKAHAAAYVMMAWRIAWYKVFHPLAYYAAYFSIRATAFSYELMCGGKEHLEHLLAEYERIEKPSKKEQDTIKDMKIVQEMYARGFTFMPLDLYQADANRFQIIDGKLMPSFSTIEGLGDKAADAVVEAVGDGKFLSKDDFRQRCKVSTTVVSLMTDLGLLGELPESNQLSLFG
ncbi:hypothetical protein FACS1894111_09400 [Clostridia bacterium]|nr:hypothetical protein FACS1894111_09400 [Clostridia bacterium]